MIVLLSPAKTLDLEPLEHEDSTRVRLLKESKYLVRALKKYTSEDLQKLMKVSENIATLNVFRYHNFKTPLTNQNSKCAIFTFKGDVYTGLDASSLNSTEIKFAQQHLRILSGLYGVLRPLDLMQAYRLEMGTRLKTTTAKNLYEYWGDKITKLLNNDLKETDSQIVINLASKEYFKAIKPKLLKGNIYNIHFKENRNGVYKIISFSAKKARGMMARYIIQNNITTPESLLHFDEANYMYNPDLSDAYNFTFTR